MTYAGYESVEFFIFGGYQLKIKRKIKMSRAYEQVMGVMGD